MKKLRLLDTFAGIGGFSYAAEKLVGGFQTVQFIEIDPYCQQVLNKNFPNIPIHDDITTYRAEPHSADVITGGFPCTDISQAGRREGITETTRSGLWFQLIRTIRMVRPKYFILENVSAILANGMDIVLRDIYEAGYDAEWCCIPSSFVGACHQRDRWWLLGFPSNSDSMQRLDVLRQQPKQRQKTQQGTSDRNNRSGNVADSNNNGSFRSKESRSIKETDGRSEKREDIFIESQGSGESTDSKNFQQSSSNPDSNRLQRKVGSRVYRPTWKTQNIRRINPNWRQYISEPTIRRGDDGLSTKLDASQRIQRLKQLGNTIVPQVAAIPLQRVIQLEREQQ
tara:strand:+ start:1859 stop:2875 length:1017 start_codon:yes stop_codon:yes gene_type:complete